MSEREIPGRVEWTAAGYVDHWEPLTSQFAPALVEALEASAGERILDVGCGTGAVAAAARERGLELLGLDFSISMTRWAARRLGRSGFVAADAARPPVARATLDRLAMNFSLHHLPDPAAALRVLAATLRPGGRLAYTTWADSELNPEEARIDAVYDRFLGEGDESAAGATDPFQLPDECAAALGPLGFDRVDVRTVTHDWRPATADAVFEAELRGGGPNSHRLSREPAERLAALRAAVCEVVADFVGPRGIAIPMTALVIAADRTADG